MAVIDREFLRSGGLSAALEGAAREGLLRLTTAEERRRSRREMLARRSDPGADVWVFAYGSLMWNPAFHYVEERPAAIHGYHRRFCLQVSGGRGSREHPGLMLGLDRGGSCRGVAFRIAAAAAEEELDIIWSRELVADGYRPVWLNAHTAQGRIAAIGFAIDTALPSYSGRLPQDAVARRIAAAAGALGPCTDYLEDTVAHLQSLGIRDRALEALRARVRQLRSAT